MSAGVCFVLALHYPKDCIAPAAVDLLYNLNLALEEVMDLALVVDYYYYWKLGAVGGMPGDLFHLIAPFELVVFASILRIDDFVVL